MEGAKELICSNLTGAVKWDYSVWFYFNKKILLITIKTNISSKKEHE